VCGEFLSPEIQVPLEQVGLWDEFVAEKPARIQRILLNFGTREKCGRLPEPGWGLSRYVLDDLLLRRAVQRGAERTDSEEEPTILASGRSSGAPKGSRLFGFKAHFTGPATDAVELYFFKGGYVGINGVENGITNVCGLAPESLLQRYGFEVDELAATIDPLRQRLKAMNRSMKWMHTGPLIFENKLEVSGSCYLAGDALSFVDPFTGSGMLCALLTGTLAGAYAAEGRPVSEYVSESRRILGSAFSVASFFRRVARTDCAGLLAACVPPRLLFALTRPVAKYL